MIRMFLVREDNRLQFQHWQELYPQQMESPSECMLTERKNSHYLTLA